MRYVRPVITYKLIEPESFLFCTLDGKLLLILFGHDRLKPEIIRASQGNVTTLSLLKQVLHACISLA